VIEDEALLGECSRKGDRGGQLTGDDEDVVREPERRERGDAAAKVGTAHEVVGLALDRVADTDELGMAREVGERSVNLRRAQVDPADHAAHERVRVRKGEYCRVSAALELACTATEPSKPLLARTGAKRSGK